jgi:hypothetical protein
MSEIEDSTEHLNEKIHEEAGEASRSKKDRWVLTVALFTALMSVLAALTGMLSGHHENESLLAQIKASDQWGFYQAKGIKQELVSTAIKMMHSAVPDTAALSRVERYKAEQEEIKKKAEELQQETEEHLQRHANLARGVTLFQISIAVSAIAILTRRKLFWYFGIVFALVACFFLMQGVI